MKELLELWFLGWVRLGSVQSIKRDYIHHQLGRQATRQSWTIAMEFLNFFDSSHHENVLKFLLFLLILLLLIVLGKFTRII